MASGNPPARPLTDLGWVAPINTLVKLAYDRVDRADSSPIVEVYTFSLSGSTIATVTITYTDSTQNKILSAVLS